MSDLLIRSRAAMLDAFEALAAHRDSIIVIGAHAIYIRQPTSSTALAPVTKDSDLALDPRFMPATPKLEHAMEEAGFSLAPDLQQPGLWFRGDGSEVDLMVPEAADPTALGSMMAGRAESTVGMPGVAAQQVALLARELLDELAYQP